MLEAIGICKKYGNHSLLDGFSLNVDRGERIGILGQSGSGKTTLLRIIAGLDICDSGELRIDGRTITNDFPPYERNISMAFQDPSLWNHMTVRENISYGMRRKNKELVDHLAVELGIEACLKLYPDQISGGQAKRVGLARALAADRKYLLLDEPLANVDPETKDTILAFLTDSQFSDKGVIYVSHDRNEMDMIGCRICEL